MPAQLSGQNQSFFVSDIATQSDTITIRLPVENSSASDVIEKYLLSLTDTGYLNPHIIQVDTTDSEILSLTLLKNNRHFLHSIQIQDADHSEFILIEDWFSSNTVQSSIVQLSDKYIRMGYPFVMIDAFGFHIADDTVRVSMQLHKGPLVTLRTLEFTGNSKLSEHYLAREAAFDKNVVFNPDTIDRVMSNLLRSRYIVDAIPVGIIKIEDHYGFVVDVEEISSSRVNAIAGFEPSTSNENRITGQIELSLNNAIAEGSAFDLNYRRISASTSRMDISYEQSWIGGWPIGIALRTNIHQRDSTYNTIHLSSKVNYEWNSGLNTGIYINYGRTNSATSNLAQLAVDNQTWNVGAIIDINELNRRLNPTSGYQIILDISTGLKKILDPSVLSAEVQRQQVQRRVYINLSNYTRLTNMLILAQRIQAAHLNSRVFWEDDVFRYGGTNSLRGYREEQLQSISYAWSDHEIRYLLDRYSYVFIFGAVGIDRYSTGFGIVQPDINSNYLYSTGAGISYRIRLGALKLTYAVGRDDSFLNGKVHFGITNSF